MAKILIVDDESEVRRAIVEIVQSGGHETHEGFDGVGALEGVKEHRPDVLLCDWMLPELFGGEVIQKIRSDSEYADFKDLPIIVVSDFADETSERKFTQAGANAFVAKNDNLEGMREELLAAITDLLEKSDDDRLEKL